MDKSRSVIERRSACVGALILAATAPAEAIAQAATVTPPAPVRDADAPPPTPFVLSERWAMGLTAQLDACAIKDADLNSSAAGDVANIRPQMQFAFLKLDIVVLVVRTCEQPIARVIHARTAG